MPFLSTNYTYSDIVFVDISLLNVQVRIVTNGAREISWNSVAGATNRVQFTTNLPPVWQTFAATNGSGSPMTVIDTSTNAARRFYRVKVDF